MVIIEHHKIQNFREFLAFRPTGKIRTGNRIRTMIVMEIVGAWQVK
jgi:hypothetical protein